MRYRTINDQEYIASTPETLIEALRQDSHTPSSSVEEFMQQTAQRCKLQSNVDVRSDSAENFVEDLVHHGFLAIVDRKVEIPASPIHRQVGEQTGDGRLTRNVSPGDTAMFVEDR